MNQENKNTIIKNDVINKIANGALVPGQAMETEAVLANYYHVSRMTVRKAIDELVFEGYLTKIYKKGTFVSQKARFDGFRFGLGYSDEIRNRGMKPSSAQVVIQLVQAQDPEIDDLRLAWPHKVWRVNRIRLADGIPIAYEDSYFPYPLIPELTVEDAAGSIYDCLKNRYQYTFSYADQRIDAIAADQELSSFLEVSQGTPLVRTFSIAYLPNGTPFNSGTCFYRTDNFKLLQSVKA